MDLLERTKAARDRAIKRNGPDSASVRMLNELLESLENPISAEETFRSGPMGIREEPKERAKAQDAEVNSQSPKR